MTTPPVQSTNIVGLLRDHAWSEVAAVEARLAALADEAERLQEYRATLVKLAEVAGIPRPEGRP